MKNILVATDLSCRSDLAILRGIKLAKEYGADLTILHVVDEDLPGMILKQTEESSEKEIKKCIQDKVDGIKCDVEVIIGDPYKSILKIAADKKMDLIILGIHRHIYDDEPMMGKVIERVINNAMKPVLVVRNSEELDYNKILVGMDFNTHCKRALDFALKTFSNSSFILLHSYLTPFVKMVGNSTDLERQVQEDSKEELENMTGEALKKFNGKNVPEVKQKITQGYVIENLHQEVKNSKPQLVVLGTHGRSGWSKIISKNVTENFLDNPPCDVLVTV